MLKCGFVKMVDLVVLDIMLDDDVVGVRLTFRNFTPFKLQYDANCQLTSWSLVEYQF